MTIWRVARLVQALLAGGGIAAASLVGCDEGQQGVHVVVAIDSSRPPAVFDHVTVLARAGSKRAAACIFQTAGANGPIVDVPYAGDRDPCADITPAPAAAPTPAQWRLPLAINVATDDEEAVEVEAFAAFGNRRVGGATGKANSQNPFADLTVELTSSNEGELPCVDAILWGTDVSDEERTCPPPNLVACPTDGAFGPGDGQLIAAQEGAVTCAPDATSFENPSTTCERVLHRTFPANRCVTLVSELRWARCVDGETGPDCRRTTDCTVPRSSVSTNAGTTVLDCLPALPYPVTISLGKVPRLERLFLDLDMAASQDERSCKLLAFGFSAMRDETGLCQ